MHFLAQLAAAFVASATLASAQTYSECNPMHETGCPDNPALSGKYVWNYASEKKDAPNFKRINQGAVLFQDDGAHFRVAKSGDSPTLISNFYIMYGRFEVKMKVAPGAGIVSSIVLQSEVLDEIDWEFLGSTPGKAQTNYFGKGNTETYDRMIEYDYPNGLDWHVYTIDWTPERVQWIIDGNVIRTLTPGEVKGDFYPQTPMHARFGPWAGGDPSNGEGTIVWAKGPTDFSQGPFDMAIEYISVQDYSTGKFYRYNDQSGAAKSIIAVDGKILGGDKNVDDHPPIQPKPEESTRDSIKTTFKAPTNSGRIPTSTGSPTPRPSDVECSGSDCEGKDAEDIEDEDAEITPTTTFATRTQSGVLGQTNPPPTNSPLDTNQDSAAVGKLASSSCFALVALVAVAVGTIF